MRIEWPTCMIRSRDTAGGHACQAPYLYRGAPESYDRTFQLPWTTWDIARKKCLYVLFPGTVMLVLACLAVPRLTLVCVCACSCVGVSISYVESLKFEGGAMVDMVP